MPSSYQYMLQCLAGRRSPRISALDASKEEQKQLARTAKINKRKFDDSSAFTTVSKLAKQVWKGRDNSKDDQSSDNCEVEWRAGRIRENQNHDAGKASELPAKHTLELVLDTLQRRDTYEIFAQPVDPNEVEDYREIIKEPMDFGTMRAKLHEGMYQNLEQFEHDVFLIPENAMHFNSSSTVYFKTARALHELANKVFHALRTDPENFVSEFSGTRRRSMRKALSISTDPKDTSKGTTTYRRGMKKNNNRPIYATEFVSGRLCEVDNRKEYEELRTSLYDHQHMNNTLQLLPLMNEEEIRYKDSLMSFVKDLGPTAQMVARRKLLSLLGEQHQPDEAMKLAPNNDASSSFKTFRDFAPLSGAASSNPFLILKKTATQNMIDLTQEDEDEEDEKEEANHDINKENHQEKFEICPTPSPADVTLSTSRNNRVAKKDRVSTRNVRPVILALEYTQYNANATEYKPRNKKNSLAMGLPPRPPKKAADQQPLSRQFTFDLPFLKARLDQMSTVPSSSAAVINKHLFHYNNSSNNYKSNSSLMDSNLALQL
ncbi:hypothetical protein CASFOL_040119 [Castilleja foliolosa]|uniref:Bromo domain-containing protein n=1 Tax=Castilleja foliolosa TaxID=1961234 RepID=A0ABD3BEL7_9LAMI